MRILVGGPETINKVDVDNCDCFEYLNVLFKGVI
jgi:hypothetical protein